MGTGVGEAARSSSAVSGLLWSGANNAAAHMVFTHSVASTLDTSTNTHPCERLANSPDKHTCDRYCRHLRSDGSQKYVRTCLLQAITAGPVPVSPSMGQTDMCSGRWGCRRGGGVLGCSHHVDSELLSPGHEMARFHGSLSDLTSLPPLLPAWGRR